MTIPFYKLQLAGNGFILLDTALIPEIDSSEYAEIARVLCDRRFGIGATGAVFLAKDNTIRIFGANGNSEPDSADALLCAARFAFDTGRLQRKSIVFKTAREEVIIDVLGAHEFRLSLGSPFSLIGGNLVTATSQNIVETLDREGTRTAYSALHIREDAVVAFPQTLGALDRGGFTALVQKAFPGRQVIPVIARGITAETLSIQTQMKLPSAACASAACSLVAAATAGVCEKDAVVFFESSSQDGQPGEALNRDRDNSRRLAVSWDTAEQEIKVIGTGGYLFEGKFDLREASPEER